MAHSVTEHILKVTRDGCAKRLQQLQDVETAWTLASNGQTPSEELVARLEDLWKGDVYFPSVPIPIDPPTSKPHSRRRGGWWLGPGVERERLMHGPRTEPRPRMEEAWYGFLCGRHRDDPKVRAIAYCFLASMAHGIGYLLGELAGEIDPAPNDDDPNLSAKNISWIKSLATGLIRKEIPELPPLHEWTRRTGPFLRRVEEQNETQLVPPFEILRSFGEAVCDAATPPAGSEAGEVDPDAIPITLLSDGTPTLRVTTVSTPAFGIRKKGASDDLPRRRKERSSPLYGLAPPVRIRGEKFNGWYFDENDLDEAHRNMEHPPLLTLGLLERTNLPEEKKVRMREMWERRSREKRAKRAARRKKKGDSPSKRPMGGVA